MIHDHVERRFARQDKLAKAYLAVEGHVVEHEVLSGERNGEH